MMSYRDDELWNAVGSKDLATVQRAILRGSDVNMVCPDSWVRDEVAGKKGTGRSLLHHAAWAGDLLIFKALVEAGANVGRRRTVAWRPNGGVAGRGSTPLHHAVMYNRRTIVEYLVHECGVDIDEPGEQGYTALHLAAKFDYPEIADLLLRAGARTDLLTRDEKTVWDLARGQQDRSHAQVGAVQALLEKFDTGGERRPKLLPGAPRPKWDNAGPEDLHCPKVSLAAAADPWFPEDVRALSGGSAASQASRGYVSPATLAAVPPLAASGPLRYGIVRPDEAALLRAAEADVLGGSAPLPGSKDSCGKLRRRVTFDSLDEEMLRHSATESGRNRAPTPDESSRGAYHDPGSASQNVGNHIGTRSSVRQSKLFRMYESGNATKALLGQQGLQWNVEEKEGAYSGRVFDAFQGQGRGLALGARDGREVIGSISGPRGRLGRRYEEAGGGSRWTTSSSTYGAGAA